MTFESESSKVMCMDKVFAQLVHKYYSTGRVDWLTDEQLKKITDRADELVYTMCGEMVPDITLPGVDQTKWQSLYSIDEVHLFSSSGKARVEALQKELPVIQKVYEEWHDKGF